MAREMLEERAEEVRDVEQGVRGSCSRRMSSDKKTGGSEYSFVQFCVDRVR